MKCIIVVAIQLLIMITTSFVNILHAANENVGDRLHSTAISGDNIPKTDEQTNEYVEMLVTFVEGGDELSIIADIITNKGEVIKRGNPYLPNIIKVKVRRKDKSALVYGLNKNADVIGFEEIKNFILESK